MKVAGVIENMASFTCPDCGSSHELFGSGGGEELAEALDTELLGRIPIDASLREGGDAGTPLLVSHPDVPASQAIRSVAERLSAQKRSLVGRSLPLAVS
jgi:ATP-binding protein involved in chromosome partitioning